MFANALIPSRISVLFVMVFMLAVTPLQVAHADGEWYAKPDGIETGNCSTWANACTLQYALAGATSGVEIWVAAGTYTPTAGTDRTATFPLKDGVALYGGFAGTETARDQRVLTLPYVTILSGDLYGDDIGFTNNDENVYHVVTGATGATLDGFTITAGNANGSGFLSYGGGMYNWTSSPALANITFSGNSASQGGGMFNYSSSSPTLTNVTFSGNSATRDGGGMYNLGSSPVLTAVTFTSNTATGTGAGLGGGGMFNAGSSPALTGGAFTGNTAYAGGGMYNYTSSPVLMGVAFSGNTATHSGGGMVNLTSSPVLAGVAFSGNTATTSGGGMYNYTNSNPTLTNVTFSGNETTNSGSTGGGLYNSGSPTLTNTTFISNAATTGGGMYNSGSSSKPTLTNVTFSGNNAITSGGGMANYSSSIPQIRNTVFWGNTAPSGAQIHDSTSTPVVSDSIVEGGYIAGTNIITTDPVLGTLGNHGGSTQTMPLLAGSSAINTGNNSTCATTDQRGVSRPQGAQCDIGAYEYDYTGTYYTKPAVSGAANCQSWDSACTLQTALATAISGDEIWAAAGTHTPTAGTDRSATFQLKDGVALYGGFAATETLRIQRDPALNVTILSGDIGAVDDNTDNSYHVVTGATGATLDGFTITAGNANDVSPNNSGGGMWNDFSSPTLTNVTFSGNSATNGGGMWNDSSSPTLTNVTFSGNSASNGGGGVLNNSSSPTLTNVTFSGNSASNGGGMWNDSSSPTLTNVTFSGNSATDGGGGTYNSYYSSPALTNVTFSGNSATRYGGGMFNSYSDPPIRNTIFWGNTAAIDGAQIDNGGTSAPVVSDSVVQDDCPTGSTCTNIIITDPMLGTLGDYGGSTQTIPLLAGSSAIDTGNDATCATTDQRGVTRPQGAQCDIGAYEYVPVPVALAGVNLAGTTTGIIESDYAFVASVAPITATTPITYLWQASGQSPVTHTAGLSDTVSFTWATAGTQAITVTASNSLGALVSASRLITIAIPVIGPTGVALIGPTIGAVQTAQAFAGTVTPISTTTPITYVWQASGQSPVTHTAGLSDTVSFTWSAPGTQAITVTASNSLGALVSASGLITIAVPVPAIGPTGVALTGPTIGAVQTAQAFAGTVTPISTTTPITYVWQASGQSPVTHTAGLSDTVSFTWSAPGTQAITVTASNSLGALVSASGLITIAVPVPAIGPTGVALTGPTIGAVETAQAFAGTVTPISTTTPITYVWQASGQSPVTHTAGLSDTASFTWATAGTQAITVTASNGVGAPVTASQAVTIVPGAEVTVDPSASSTLTYTAANTSTTTVEVPAGAVTQTTTLLYTMVPTATPPSGFGFAGHAFTLEAYHNGAPLLGFALQQPVTVTINYSDADAVGVDESTLKLDYWTGNAWVDAATTCTPVSAYTRNLTMNQLSVPICHLTQFAVFGVEQHSLSITRLNPSPTNLASVDFTVTFSETVSGVDASDFALTASGVTGASIIGVSGGTTVYTVTVNTGTGNGAIRLDVSSSATISDVAGYLLAGLLYTGGESYTVDKTAPTVVSSVRADPNPSNAASVNFTVTFSEAVSGVDMVGPLFDDFVLTTTGVTGATVTGVSGSGTNYTATVNTGSGAGTIRLDVVDNDTILDLALNPLGGAGAGNGSHTSGETYDVRFHRIYLPLVFKY